MVGCALCPKKTECCVISMDSLVAVETQTGSESLEQVGHWNCCDVSRGCFVA